MKKSLEDMLRKLADLNTEYGSVVLDQEKLALALADAVSGELGFSWVKGKRMTRARQLDVYRPRSSGQTITGVFTVAEDTVVGDLAISDGNKGSPGSAFPQYGKFSGRTPRGGKDYSIPFALRFHRGAEYRFTLAEALAFITTHFHWSSKTMNKIVNVNYDERQLPRNLRPTTVRLAVEMIEDLLEKCNIRGQFLLKHRQQTQSRSERRIKVPRAVGSSVRLTVRPGDNSTCWEYDLVCPGTVDAAILCQKLQAYLKQSIDQEEDEPIAKDRLITQPAARIAVPRKEAPPAQSPVEVKKEVQEEAIHTNGAASVDVIKMLSGAVERRASREQRLQALEKERQVLSQELATLQAKIADVESKQASIMAEDEADVQGRAAEGLLKQMESFFKSTSAPL